MIQWISTEEDFNRILDESKHVDCLLLKHSTYCPVSSRVHYDMNQLSEELNSAKFFGVKVIEDRSVSNLISNHFSIRHESPQLLLIKNGIVSFHESHYAITKAEVLSQLAK